MDQLLAFFRTSILRVIVWALPPWIFPPANREPFEWAGSAAMPAIGASATILSFTVPQARNGVIVRLGNTTTNGNYIDGAGGLVWMILQNGVPVENFEAIVNQLGTVQAPSEVSNLEIRAQDLIQLVVQNVNLPATGRLSGRLGGWFYPQNLEAKGSFAA
jgi:hypothetical protein